MPFNKDKNNLKQLIFIIDLYKHLNSGIRAYVFDKYFRDAFDDNIQYLLNSPEIYDHLTLIGQNILKDREFFRNVYFNEFDGIPNDHKHLIRHITNTNDIYRKIGETDDTDDLLFLFSVYVIKANNNIYAYNLENFENFDFAKSLIRDIRYSIFLSKYQSEVYKLNLHSITYLIINYIDLLLYINENKNYDPTIKYHNKIEPSKGVINSLLENDILNLNSENTKLLTEFNDKLVAADESQLKFNSSIIKEKVNNAFKYKLIDSEKYKRHLNKDWEKANKAIISKKNELAKVLYPLHEVQETGFNIHENVFGIKWNDIYSLDSNSWGFRIKEFYSSKFSKYLDKSEYYNIDQNSTLFTDLITIYIYDLIINSYRNNDLKIIKESVEKIIDICEFFDFYSKFSSLIKGILIDLNEIEVLSKVLLNSKHPAIHISEFISLEQGLGDSFIQNTSYILASTYTSTDKFYTLYKDEIISYTEDYLQEKNEASIIRLFQNNLLDISEDMYQEIRYLFEETGYKYALQHYDYDKIKNDVINFQNELKLPAKKNKYKDVYRARFDLFDANQLETKINHKIVPLIGSGLITTEVLDLMYQNKLKEIKSLFIEENELKYGDARWTSEKYVFFSVQKKFKDLKVFHHYSPPFLGLQHYDIYIPSQKIAVEYNGRQHYEPVEFFGGIEGFKETIRRDKKKKEISEKYGVTLLTHKYDEPIEYLLEKLSRIIS
jgi:hypothetical protein